MQSGRRPSRLAQRRERAAERTPPATMASPLRGGDGDGLALWASTPHFKQQTHIRLLAAHSARVLQVASHPLSKRAQGRPGAGWHPQDSRARTLRTRCTGEMTGQPKHPAFPAQWVDGLYALSPETNSVLPPSPSRNSRTPPRLKRRRLRKGLTVATTARTTRFCRTRSAPLVERGPRCAHEVQLALHTTFRIDAARVHRSLIRGS